jgi:hypothetical protein
VADGHRSRSAAPSAAGTPPEVTTVVTGEPVVDPTTLLKRTRTFFAEVASNAKAAADLAVGTIRDDTTALIQRKYGGLSSIQLQSMSLDPTSALTVSALRVVNKDGTTHTRHITLQFTLSSDPKIINPGG